MTEPTQDIWLAKLAAWTHDPAEKALVLLRDPAGHEGGTVRELREALFPNGLPKPMAASVQRADHWASAADRPQFPRDMADGPYAAWTQVRFEQQPVLIHPLSGAAFDLGKTGRLDIDPAHIKLASSAHFKSLIEADAQGEPDAKKTALAFWRFGPEIDADGLRMLWQLLPADTRIPDHTIWTHLDLTSAFASAFEGDPDANPALLNMSFGPVQDFIAQARTTSDLWAGSHLLSRLAWEAMRVICERLGPDAVLFPQLRGVPQVDLWLRDEMGLNPKRFMDCEWAVQKTDANPLFAAALPNKFVAVVPAAEATELAEAVTSAVRAFVRDTASGMLTELLEAAGIPDSPELACREQLRAQLDGFPEVHWAAVPFAPLIEERTGEAPETRELAALSEPFFSTGEGSTGGFLASETWKRLSRPLDLEGTRFYRPNPGVLYPAIYELLDRVAASAKSVRAAPQRADGGEEGYRCDLTGEAEWLTHERALLTLPKGARKDAQTLWNLATRNRPGISRKGEHLSALAMLKRLWPTWFVKRELASVEVKTQRFVISTHTLAIATSLEHWLETGAPFGDAGKRLLEKAAAPDIGNVALPRSLVRQIFRAQDFDADTRSLARALPALLDKDASDDPEVHSENARLVEKLLGKKPEAYYALILLDGDSMGAWISGTDPRFQVATRRTFHPQIGERMKAHFTRPEHQAYLDAPRAVSPSRHMAISSALNGFALHLAQDIVENRCKGKLIYAGGDDVMALVSVDDLLACLTLLRAAYGGLPMPKALSNALSLDLDGLSLGGGHAVLGDRLIRLMGEQATASAGAVIAHHTAPLGAVVRELRKSERRAKNKGGRNAFDITLLKRSGGATELTLPWNLSDAPTLEDSPMQLLAELQNTFAADRSRKAAYLTQDWLPNLPSRAHMPVADLQALLTASLAYQFKRQGAKTEGARAEGEMLARKLAAVALAPRLQDTQPAETVRDLLAVAEFLARQDRSKKER